MIWTLTNLSFANLIAYLDKLIIPYFLLSLPVTILKLAVVSKLSLINFNLIPFVFLYFWISSSSNSMAILHSSSVITLYILSPSAIWSPVFIVVIFREALVKSFSSNSLGLIFSKPSSWYETIPEYFDLFIEYVVPVLLAIFFNVFVLIKSITDPLRDDLNS